MQLIQQVERLGRPRISVFKTKSKIQCKKTIELWSTRLVKTFSIKEVWKSTEWPCDVSAEKVGTVAWILGQSRGHIIDKISEVIYRHILLSNNHTLLHTCSLIYSCPRKPGKELLCRLLFRIFSLYSNSLSYTLNPSCMCTRLQLLSLQIPWTGRASVCCHLYPGSMLHEFHSSLYWSVCCSSSTVRGVRKNFKCILIKWIRVTKQTCEKKILVANQLEFHFAWWWPFSLNHEHWMRWT